MKRREFIRAIGLSALVWPVTTLAQQGMRHVGVLMGTKAMDPEGQKQATALQRAVRELGWLPGRNIEIEFRWHGGDTEKARALATELVDLHPDLVVAAGTPSLFAVQQATRTIQSCLSTSPIQLLRASCKASADPAGNTRFWLKEP